MRRMYSIEDYVYVVLDLVCNVVMTSYDRTIRTLDLNSGRIRMHT